MLSKRDTHSEPWLKFRWVQIYWLKIAQCWANLKALGNLALIHGWLKRLYFQVG